MGAKKINTIWKELEIETIGELLYACNENRLLLYKGFGEKTQQNIKTAIEFYLQNQGSYLYAQIIDYAARPHTTDAGSLPTVFFFAYRRTEKANGNCRPNRMGNNGTS